MSTQPASAATDQAPSPDPETSTPGPTARQLVLLEGGEASLWSLSPRTRAVGKRGIAEARSVLARSSRVGRGAPLEAPSPTERPNERKAG